MLSVFHMNPADSEHPAPITYILSYQSYTQWDVFSLVLTNDHSSSRKPGTKKLNREKSADFG